MGVFRNHGLPFSVVVLHLGSNAPKASLVAFSFVDLPFDEDCGGCSGIELFSTALTALRKNLIRFD